MIRGQLKRTVAAILAVLVLSAGSPALAADSVILSALFPGLGQAQDGHYTKATIFASAALISATGLFATQVEYARSTERYENEKRTYLHYQDEIDAGQVVSIDDVNATYANMDAAYNDADNDEKWRNIFLGAFIATWSLNLVDILLSDKDTGEIQQPAEPNTSLELNSEGFRVVRTLRF